MSEEYIKYLNDSPNLIFNDTAMEVSYAMAYLENKEVWDKLPDEEKSKKMKENFWEAYRMYLEDKVVTDFVAKISPLLSAKDITCIVINQARDDFKNPYADFAIPCGNSLKHACSMILVFQKGKFFDETLAEKPNSIDSPVGNIVMVRVQKTKVCKPDRRIGYYTLTYDDGIDVITDVIPVAVSYGLLDKGGSWYRITDGNGSYLTDAKGDILKFQGIAQLHAFLKETPDVLNFMLDYINEQIVKDGISPALQISQEMDDSAFKDGVLNLAGETDEE